ncbi:MAG: MBL fold metallo-hydrolase [Actinomycetota bacterium]|nr:MBL fold metallo-hydrolase [Actinomycetota bacterium]
MQVQELRPGVWRWTLPHPEWTPEDAADDGWDRVVSSFFLRAGGALLLVDPLAPPPDSPEHERFWRALDRDVEGHGSPPHVLLTVFWHARSTEEVATRYAGTSVWVHERAAREFGERIAFSHTFALDDDLPGGVRAIDAHRRGEVLLWVPEHRALVAGDVLLGTTEGSVRVCPDSWLPPDLGPAAFRAALRPLLELPVDLVLLAHGEPVLVNAREALAAALTDGDLARHSPPSAR